MAKSTRPAPLPPSSKGTKTRGCGDFLPEDMKYVWGVIVVVLFLFWVGVVNAQTIKPFSSDLCTHYPNHNKKGSLRPYTECCFRHDLEYWIGGSRADRRRADKNLMACFEEKSTVGRSKIVHAGVRIFGKKYWGYAWKYTKPAYWEITPAQKEKVLQSLSESDIIDLESLLFIIEERKL